MRGIRCTFGMHDLVKVVREVKWFGFKAWEPIEWRYVCQRKRCHYESKIVRVNPDDVKWTGNSDVSI